MFRSLERRRARMGEVPPVPARDLEGGAKDLGTNELGHLDGRVLRTMPGKGAVQMASNSGGGVCVVVERRRVR